MTKVCPVTDEAGWLIEDNSSGHTLYMAMVADGRFGETKEKHIGRFKFDRYESPLQFVKNANEALRFGRQEDAEAFVRVFRRFMLCPEVTGHEWPAPTAMEAARIPDPEATKLREALEPFAAVADDPCFAGHEDSYAPRPSRGRPCLGDYRRARDVLAALNPSPALVGDEDAAR
jgi:hypothetical protein